MAALFVSQILIVIEASQVLEVISGNCEGGMAAAAHHMMNIWAAFFQVEPYGVRVSFVHFVLVCISFIVLDRF